MTQTFNNGARDEALLMEGRYKEWFWQNLRPESINFLNTDEDRHTQTRVCGTCEVRKPLGAFNIGTMAVNGQGRNRCNKCELNVERGKDSRWEDTSPVDWQKQASCVDAELGVFFPEDTLSVRAVFLAPDAEWRQYCPTCPVKQICEDYAYKSKSSGIFGGKLFKWKSATVTVTDGGS